MKQTENLMKT